jgi:hypothetical protein
VWENKINYLHSWDDIPWRLLLKLTKENSHNKKCGEQPHISRWGIFSYTKKSLSWRCTHVFIMYNFSLRQWNTNVHSLIMSKDTGGNRIHQRIHCNVTRMHQFANNLKRKKKTSKITMWRGTQNFLGPWGGNTLKADSQFDLRDTRHGVEKNISYAAIDKCAETVRH